MPLCDHIKSPRAVFSPITVTNSPSNNMMYIKSNDIEIIQWYINTRLADDKDGKILLSIIFDNIRNTKYSDISPIFLDVFKSFVKKYGLKKGGVSNSFSMENVIIHRSANENININKFTHCIKFFFNEVLAFLGKKVEYNNIIVNNF